MLHKNLIKSFNGVSRIFDWIFVLQFWCSMNLIAATRAKGGLVCCDKGKIKSSPSFPLPCPKAIIVVDLCCCQSSALWRTNCNTIARAKHVIYFADNTLNVSDLFSCSWPCIPCQTCHSQEAQNIGSRLPASPVEKLIWLTFLFLIIINSSLFHCYVATLKFKFYIKDCSSITWDYLLLGLLWGAV